MDARLFRITLEVGDVDRARTFYGKLLDTKGRPVGGGRVYFDCGPVILALLDPEKKPKPLAEHIYFAVKELETVHARAKKLRCLSKEKVHGESAADVVERPWGERSFYAEDPWGNGLCFVDERTLFTGERTRG